MVDNKNSSEGSGWFENSDVCFYYNASTQPYNSLQITFHGTTVTVAQSSLINLSIPYDLCFRTNLLNYVVQYNLTVVMYYKLDIVQVKILLIWASNLDWSKNSFSAKLLFK